MNPDSNLHVLIGYDERQDTAWKICAESIREQASRPISIYKLDHRLLRKLGLFNRGWEVEGDTGRSVDKSDGRPFSTQFAHSRFLVPAFCDHLGLSVNDAALFVDSDFVFLDDPYKILWEAAQSPGYPVYCVKHSYSPAHTVKMDNQDQAQYQMKLWSSLMLFDLSRPMDLDKEKANTMSGRDLHTFQWLPKDAKGNPLIGNLSERWNFIPDHSEERIAPENIGAIHWTEGVPSIPGYEYTRYAAIYNAYRRKINELELERGFYD